MFSSSQVTASSVCGRSRKIEPWFSSRKSGRDRICSRRVGELPEAAEESLCEDIMPPSGEDAFESLGGLRWFLPLQAVSLLSNVSTVAFSRLGCWTPRIAVTLDTVMRIPQFRLGADSTEVPKRFTIALYSVVLIVSEASGHYCEKCTSSGDLVTVTRTMFASVIFVVLSGLGSAESQIKAQLAPADLVKAVIRGELQPADAYEIRWKYLLNKEIDGKQEVREVVETKSGSLDRLLAIAGRPLTDAQQRDETERILRLSHSPEAQREWE
jgi:hypothetical protein